MANLVYTKGKEKILSGAINFATDTLKVALVKQSYAVVADTHEFLSDLGANRLSTDQTLTSQAVTGGVFDAADPVFPSVTSGDTAASLVVYKSTGVDSTSPLLFYFDQISGFPLTTNGGNISPEWDNGTKKIYKL